MEQRKTFSFSEDLLLGVATAATQIEGGDKNNTWYDWAEKKKVKDGSSPLRANDHYNRFEEDTDLMASLNIQAYRMSVEWSRIEPEQGVFNEEAIKHYRAEIELLHKKGIKVLVTLHHFSNPLWFEKLGGFLSTQAAEIFLSYVSYVVNGLCDLVDEWITINEPNIYTVNGFVFGSWPPGKKGFGNLRKVYASLALCHILSYREIHRICDSLPEGAKPVRVSFANHLVHFEPLNPKNIFHQITTKIVRSFFQRALTFACASSIFKFPVKRFPKSIRRLYKIEPGKYYDFISINYYMRYAVTTFGYAPHKETLKNDLGWEIYPQGLIIGAKDLYKKYHAPIYVTENGTCDAKDAFRSRFIYDHLKVMSESGLPFERYFYWTFIDNFEWLEGESARFGLVELDFESQKRTVRKSGEFYSKVIKEHGVTQELYDQYVEKSSGGLQK